MTYFYNSNTGAWANESPPSLFYFQYETQLRIGAGWHAYSTYAAMTAAVQANNWPALSSNASGASPVPGQAAHDVHSAATSVTSDVLKPLFQANLWIRVAEVALGLLLIAIGVAKLTRAVPAATKIAKTAGAVALA